MYRLRPLLLNNHLDIEYRKLSLKEAERFWILEDPDADNDIDKRENLDMLKDTLTDGGSLYGAYSKDLKRTLAFAACVSATIDTDWFSKFNVTLSVKQKRSLVNGGLKIIQSVFTVKEFRKRGIAKKLISKIVKDNNDKSAMTMLFVNNDNYSAQRVYISIGFKKIGNVKDQFLLLYSNEEF